MQKYRLINLQTKEETICDKTVIDGFDYYITNINPVLGSKYLDDTNTIREVVIDDPSYWHSRQDYESVICTNNPNAGIPQIIDLAEQLAKEIYRDNPNDLKDANYKYNTDTNAPRKRKAFINGYNKCLETNGNSNEDMIEFAKFFKNYEFIDDTSEGELYAKASNNKQPCYTIKELLEIWKEQKPIKLHYGK